MQDTCGVYDLKCNNLAESEKKTSLQLSVNALLH